MPVFIIPYSVILSETKNPLHACVTSGFQGNSYHRSRVLLSRARTVASATVGQPFRINDVADIAQPGYRK